MKHKSKEPYRPEVRAILFCRGNELRIILRQKIVSVSLVNGQIRTSKE